MTSTDSNVGPMDMVAVPLDGSEFSERALVPGAALAARTGAELVVYSSAVNGPTIDPRRYLVDALARAGSPAATQVATDDPVVHGLQYAIAGAENPVICMSTHGQSGVFHALLGSVADQISRAIAVPMLLVGRAVDLDLGSRFDTAVVCTDGSDTSLTIIPVVESWIRALRLRPWVVQVLDPDVRRDLARADETVTEENLVSGLARQLTTDETAPANWEVLHGDAVAEQIVDFAARLPASLLAMATHGRTGLARLALGSVAGRVVNTTPCPVLVTRPVDLR